MRFAFLVLVLFAACCGCGDSTSDAARDARVADGPDEAPFVAASPVDALQLPVRRDAGPLVAFLGDSIAAGLHLAADEAFPSVIQRLLAEDGTSFRLVNAGTSGRTTAGGLAAVDWLLGQEPDVVVVELGGNDGLRGLPVATVESNLVGIIERVQASGAAVLLLGVRLPPSYGQSYSEEFAALYPALAERFELAFVPFFMEGVGGVAELNLPDGLHPTVEGQQMLAGRVAPALAALLRERSERDEGPPGDAGADPLPAAAPGGQEKAAGAR